MSTTVPTRPRRAALEPTAAVVAVATLLGFALRLAACRGDAGLDEIWSMRLVERLHALSGVFWGLSHDNNHFLNSAWLYLVGPDAPVWAWRLPATLLGTLTIPALARLCGRRGAAAGILAALIGAVAMPLVDFGSEARGYAGLALATVVAFDEAGRAADAASAGRQDRAAAWRLGLAVGFGLLCHLTMAYALAVVGVALLVRVGIARGPAAAVRAAFATLAPAALLAVPAAGCVLAGIAVRGRFTIGDVDPFGAGKLLSGFGEMMLLASGLPDTLPPVLGAAGALGLLAVAARARLAAPWTLAVGAAALIALPLAVAALRLPNVVYARYYAVPAMALVPLLSEALGTLIVAPRSRRAAAGAAAACLLGALALDAAAMRDGRGSFSATLALMDRDVSAGRPSVAADLPYMAGLLLGEAARRAGVPPPAVVPEAELCARAAEWFVAVGVDDERPDGAVEAGPAACRTRYRLSRAFPASPLSGTGWTLYRRG